LKTPSLKRRIDGAWDTGNNRFLAVRELKIQFFPLVAGPFLKVSKIQKNQILPAGYIYDGTGKVVLDPDRRICEAIGLVFKKYREISCARNH